MGDYPIGSGDRRQLATAFKSTGHRHGEKGETALELDANCTNMESEYIFSCCVVDRNATDLMIHLMVGGKNTCECVYGFNYYCCKVDGGDELSKHFVTASSLCKQ